ncbi:unnamed protein product [Soboliphyme baturini]|uniref:Retrovirus-related Pol polyprotein from transposon 17.6 n=1 Tax=Soboliphyme baturini TaxID=241478 RepID=A0A183J7U1_9BILA|nr:unnamed protein product [Soboliphyme baturini]
MPFGLFDARLLSNDSESVLHGMRWTSCLVYLDHVTVFGRTVGEHMDTLKDVLSHLIDVGFKMKKIKCPWVWTPVCERAFDEFKKRLSNAPFPKYPQLDVELTLVGKALGQCWLRFRSKSVKEGVVAYASQSLTKP